MNPDELFAELEESSPEFRRAWASAEPQMRLGSNIYRLRVQRGITQQELARRAGMRQPRIAELERGDANPKQDTIVRVANALGVDIAELYARAVTQPFADAMYVKHISPSYVTAAHMPTLTLRPKGRPISVNPSPVGQLQSVREASIWIENVPDAYVPMFGDPDAGRSERNRWLRTKTK